MKLVKYSLLLPPYIGLAFTLLQQKIINDIIAADTIHDKLTASEIIPQVLDDFEPTYSLEVIYPSYESVTLGNTIPVKHVAHKPIFTITRLSPTEPGLGKVFTLILTDPDAKSRENPKWSEMCHWILTNVTSPADIIPNRMQMLYDAPSDLVAYKAPRPPKKTGPHRYVFVLLEGDSSNDINAPTARKHWGYKKIRHGVRDWADENELTVVGANFFYAQHEKQ